MHSRADRRLRCSSGESVSVRSFTDTLFYSPQHSRHMATPQLITPLSEKKKAQHTLTQWSAYVDNRSHTFWCLLIAIILSKWLHLNIAASNKSWDDVKMNQTKAQKSLEWRNKLINSTRERMKMHLFKCFVLFCFKPYVIFCFGETLTAFCADVVHFTVMGLWSIRSRSLAW